MVLQSLYKSLAHRDNQAWRRENGDSLHHRSLNLHSSAATLSDDIESLPVSLNIGSEEG